MQAVYDLGNLLRGAVAQAAARLAGVNESDVDLSNEALSALVVIYCKIGAAAVLLCLLFNLPAVVRRIVLWCKGFCYLAASTDTKYKPMPDAPPSIEIVERRRIVFIRHAESLWNETFNRSFNPIFFIPRLLRAMLTETFLFVAGYPDSWFFDSPLSPLGRSQVEELHKFLRSANTASMPKEKAEIVELLRGSGNAERDSMIVVSPLRRCVSTVAIGLQERLRGSREKMLVLSELAEISRNVDTLSLASKGSAPTTPWREAADPALDIASLYEKHVDASKYKGNKPIRSCGLDRLCGFAEFAFKTDKKTIIVGGHSLFLREFFKNFCRRAFGFAGKVNKLENAGVVAFTLGKGKRADGSPVYLVLDETHGESIVSVFKDFEKPKAKKH